jgi:hypothetical protein
MPGEMLALNQETKHTTALNNKNRVADHEKETSTVKLVADFRSSSAPSEPDPGFSRIKFDPGRNQSAY